MRAPEPLRGIKLYTQPMNPFAQKVGAALALKGLAFERIVSEDPEDIARWSPIEKTLPVLEIDGHRKADSSRIVAWLDALHPEPPLFARDPKIAEAQRHLAEWSDSSFAWYWNRWRAARHPQPGDERPVDASVLSRLIGQVGRRLGRAPTTRAEARELEIISELEGRLTDLVGFLRDRPFFHADEPSVADLSIYAMLCVMLDGPIPNSRQAVFDRPTLADFVERMNERIARVECRDPDAVPPA